MADANQDQFAYWNGEVGQRWARRQRDLDAVFTPLTETLFEAAALRPGVRVLDVGCGAGETSLIAARTIGPEGLVVAADISTPMLAVARDRAEREAVGAAPITWIEADAEHDDLGAQRFDAAFSRFGVMFFSDSERAFANLRRVLVPGGGLTFLCWFRFADDARLRRTLTAGGFSQIAMVSIERPLTLGPSAEVAARFAVEMGPAARMLRNRDDTLRERARKVLTEAFAARFGTGPVVLDASCWLVSATA